MFSFLGWDSLHVSNLRRPLPLEPTLQPASNDKNNKVFGGVVFFTFLFKIVYRTGSLLRNFSNGGRGGETMIIKEFLVNTNCPGICLSIDIY